MKVVLQACIGSVILHIIYFIGTVGVGYLKTKFYEPDIEGKWDSAATLQNEVAFGRYYSPWFFLMTFVGAAVICGVILIFFHKLKS